MDDIYARDDPKASQKILGALHPRLSGLTAIILGEGLNGICSTLHQSMGTLGLAAITSVDAVAVLLILCFLWLLYFDGKWVLALHLP